VRRAFSSIAGGGAPLAVAMSVRLRGGARSRDAGETGGCRSGSVWLVENDKGGFGEVSFPRRILRAKLCDVPNLQWLEKCSTLRLLCILFYNITSKVPVRCYGQHKFFSTNIKMIHMNI
jgi:hypothetical protein